MSNNRPPRILITRLSHIGDCVLTLPVACAIKSHWPDSVVAWAVEAPSNQLLESHPAIDHLIRVERGYLKSRRGRRHVRQQIRSFGFDASIDPQSLTKSAAIAWLGRIPRRIGFARGVGRELALLLNNHRVRPQHDHLVDRSLELLRPLGIERAAVEFNVPRFEAAGRTVAAWLDQTMRGEFAIINPGAGWPSKVWPAERFGAVAEHLGRVCSLPSVVVWAGDEERAWAETIVAGSGGYSIPAPATNLQELSELLRRARMFVGSDTGPLHLAAAVGTTCVSMYGPTLPANCGPYGPQHIALQEYYQSGSSRQRRRGPNDAMKAIQVDTVAKACENALTSTRASTKQVA